MAIKSLFNINNNNIFCFKIFYEEKSLDKVYEKYLISHETIINSIKKIQKESNKKFIKSFIKGTFTKEGDEFYKKIYFSNSNYQESLKTIKIGISNNFVITKKLSLAINNFLLKNKNTKVILKKFKNSFILNEVMENDIDIGIIYESNINRIDDNNKINLIKSEKLDTIDVFRKDSSENDIFMNFLSSYDIKSKNCKISVSDNYLKETFVKEGLGKGYFLSDNIDIFDKNDFNFVNYSTLEGISYVIVYKKDIIYIEIQNLIKQIIKVLI